MNFLQTLRQWAASPAAEKNLQSIFGDHINWVAACRHLDALQRGDFSLLPPIEVLEGAAMPGLWGGYSRDLRRIFLSADCPEELITPVLLEEIGHFFDQEFCAEETPGDEGALFAAVVIYGSADATETSAWVSENDLHEIKFANALIPVEAAPKVRGSAKTNPQPTPKVRGKGGSKTVPDTSISQDGNVIYANKDSVRLVQTKANQRVIGSQGNDTFAVITHDVRLEDPKGGTDTVESNISFSLANFSFIERLTLTGTSNIHAAGNNSANLITGNSGNNILSGGGGNDTIIGGGGNDTYQGGEANDSLYGSLGSESLNGGAGNDTLVGGGGNDFFDGGTGVDSMVGGSGNDTYILNDTLDKIVEASGSSGGTDTIQTTQTILSMAAYGNVENLSYSGSGLGVTFTGNSGSNTIAGTSGADSLDGASGADSLIGGAGHDTYFVDSSSDRIFENTNAGKDLVISIANTHTLGANVESLILNGSNNISGFGNDLKNSITGNNANNTLSGQGGDDYIVGDGQLPSISFTGRSVTGVGKAYLLNRTNALVADLGSPSGLSNAGAFGERTVTRGDDNSSSAIDITSIFGSNGLNLYGNQVKNIYINTNGNITFGNSLSTFSPVAIDGGIGTAIIAPFWADVDTRTGRSNVSTGGNSTGSNLIYWDVDADNRVLTITWDDVRYFGQQTSGANPDTKVNAFQVQLIDSGGGNAFIVFRYENIDWTTGTASGGVRGLGGQAARAGFNSGTGTIIELPQSGDDLSMLELDQRLPLAGLNSQQPGVYIYEIRNGSIVNDFGGNDSLLGGAGNDFILGNGGNDTLLGGADDDSLDGGAGADSMLGGAGNDAYVVDNAGDVVVEASGEGDNDRVTTSISYTLGGGVAVEILELTGQTNQNLGGNTYGNTLIGNSGDNSLRGMGGDDSLVGGEGVDTLIGGSGNDDYLYDGVDIILENGGEGRDTVRSALDYTLINHLEYLILTGSDTISGVGNALGNTIIGNASDNSLDGGAGNDSLVGGTGNDTYFVDASGDVLVEAASEGTDLVVSRVSHSLGNNIENIIYAGMANVLLSGNNLDNIIDGSAGGNNMLSGGDGNDTLIVHGRRIGVVDGGNDSNWLRVTGDLLAFRNPSFNNIEVLDLSLLSGSASVTLNAASSGLETLIASSFNDTIDATVFSSAITIDASASSGARLIGSTSNTNQNTLIGGSAGGNEFVLGSISTNSLVGGADGLDTLTLENGGNLQDSDFATVSYIGTLKLEGSSPNTVSLGSNALIAGIRTLVGGEGDDNGTGNTFDASDYGSAGFLFQITDQDYLANIAGITGSEGIDTLKFSRDGVSVTDENVANLTNIDVLRTANGNNLFILSDQFVAAGLDSIIGGTGADTLDISDNAIYTPTPVSDVPGATSDIITFDASEGSGYTLIGTTVNFPFAKVVGGNAGGAVILDGNSLADADFANMYQANARTLTMRTETGVAIELGQIAKGSGLTRVNMAGGDDQIDVRAFAGTLTVSGGGGNDLLETSFAAFADLTFTGLSGDDTLQLVDSEARSITSLRGEFDALVLNAGNNFVALGNDAGLSTIYGGTGIDTISMLNNTTGIHFIMDPSRLGALSGFNSLNGGSGSDTLGLSNAPATPMLDGQFTRIGLRNLTGGGGGEIENFVTFFDPLNGAGGNSYELGTISDNAGISKVFVHSNDNVDASARQALASKAINFVYTDPTAIGTTTVQGTGKNDTLTALVDSANPSSFSIADTDLTNFDSVEVFVFDNDSSLYSVNMEIGTEAEDSGLATFIGGAGDDTFDGDGGGYTLNSSMVGGAGNDDVLGGAGIDTLVGSSGTALGVNEIDTLTGGAGNDTFIVGDASNAFYNTATNAGDYVLITDFSNGDIIQLRDLAAAYAPATPPATNTNGYVVGGNIYTLGAAAIGTANSFIYVDTDKSGGANPGDNLIAAIDTGGAALVQADLANNTRFRIV